LHIRPSGENFLTPLIIYLMFFVMSSCRSLSTVLSTYSLLSLVVTTCNITAHIYLPHLPHLTHSVPTCMPLLHMYTLVYNLLWSSSTTVALYY
jgi:hypothetical protein